MRTSHFEFNRVSCALMIAIALLNTTVGAWSVNLLLALFSIDIPLFGDIIIGLFAGQITIPLALIVLLLRWFGVNV